MQSRTMGNNIVLAKFDYMLNDSNTLSGFANYMRSSGDRAIQTPIVLGNVGRNGTDNVRIHSYNARLTSTLGPHRVNELRFQWSRDFESEIADVPPPEVYANGSGNFSFGRATFLQRYALPDEHRMQFVDNFSYIRGRHAFKFGGEINRVHFDGGDTQPVDYSEALLGGRFAFGDFTASGAVRIAIDRWAKYGSTPGNIGGLVQFAYAPDAVVAKRELTGFGKIFKKAFSYGRSGPALFRRDPRLIKESVQRVGANLVFPTRLHGPALEIRDEGKVERFPG